MKIKPGGKTSSDAILLALVKLVTISLSFVVTRLLSQNLSKHDYGTYSQILLLVSTVTSVTILGMADGVNYFYCSEKDEKTREAYISTLFALQTMVSLAAGSLVMLLVEPICTQFENPDVRPLLIFAAGLPFLQNLLAMVQVLLVSVGKARMLALRNFLVAVIRLAVVVVVVCLIRNVAVILLTTLILDLVQVLLFWLVLKKNNCPIRPKCINFRLFRQIFRYCAPMAVFTTINALNRDCDKYLVALWTDTETLAVYANASKVLPFDIILSSFSTVLLPQITRLVSQREGKKAAELYRSFLEITYISTAILCCAVLAAAPQVMELLYSKKYLSGLSIFILYILVDLFRFTNITLILSAAGKTKKLMFLGAGALAVNAGLNVVLYQLLGLPGPALGTLLVTVGMGLVLLSWSAKELGVRLRDFFRVKFLVVFALESLGLCLLLSCFRSCLTAWGLSYVPVMLITCLAYGGVMLLLHGKGLLSLLGKINTGGKE